MNIYCLKCKLHTQNINETESVTKNNKPILKAKCATCDRNKFRFLKSLKSGGDIVSSVISKIPVEFHLRSLKGKKYSFCGPNTNLDKRLNADDTPKEWSKPINKVDEVCLHHDLAYKYADEGKGTRHEADKNMLEELNNLKDLNFNEKLARAAIKPIIGTKYKLGLGLKKNNSLEAKELHKPIIRKFKRRKVIVHKIDDIWSADLVDMQPFSRQNKGYRYLLTVIDIFSKFAWAIPLKTKTGKEMIEAFEILIKDRKPNKLWTDAGKEFVNQNFKKFLLDNGIELYQTFNEGKAVVIERFNRTLKEKMYRYFTETNGNKYLDNLPKLISNYNNTIHSTIKMTPTEGSKLENANKIHYSSEVTKDKPKFKIGDRVRIYKYKKLFSKGYETNWTKEIFEISEIKPTSPITYKIRDLNGEEILGSFYKQELNLSSL
jgi:hypothetical protein